MKLRIYLTGLAFIGLIFLNIAYSQPAPTGCMPANNSAEFTTYVSFSWDYSTDSDVEGYELIITCNGNTQSYFPEDPWVDNVELDAGTTISWSVAATIQGVAGPSSSQSFIIPSEPIITSISPNPAPANWGNVAVTISGSNFGTIWGSVQFYCGAPKIQTVQGSIQSWADGTITCLVPYMASSGPVIITTNYKSTGDGWNTDKTDPNAQFDVSFGYNGGQWPIGTNSLTSVGYQILPGNYNGTLANSTINTDIDNAAKIWTETGGSNFSFINQTDIHNTNNSIYFGPLDNSNNTAETHTQIANGIISKIYTVLNPSNIFDQKYNLQTSMTHEFGHWLSLADLYGTDDQQKIMYGNYAAANTSLAPDDKSGIVSLYGSNGGGTSTNGNGNVPSGYPFPPTNVQAVINGSNIVLTWNNPRQSNTILYIYKNSSSIPILGTSAGMSNSINYSYTDIGAANSLPATYTVCANNNVGMTSATPITIPSNIISSSTHWSGIVDISNVTVNNGITLTVNPGTILLFSQGASLIVNGILNANGTSLQPITFTSTSGTSPGSWGSIILSGSGANGSSLNYINMQYGTEIEALNTSNITIQNSTIQNCTYGIYGSIATGSILNNTIKNVTGSAIMLNASATDCKYNVIYKTPGFAYYYIGYGLEYFNGSTGTVYQNDIAGMNQGVNVYNRAWISSNGPDDNNKNNRITNCSKGLYVYYMSTAILGTTPNTGGQWNSIYNNGYNVMLGEHGETGSEVYAYGNWWGSYPPNTALFSVRSPSTFYDYSPLNSDPWINFPVQSSGIPLTLIIADNKTINAASTSQSESGQALLQLNSSSSGSSIEPLLDGIALLHQNRYNDAKNFFLSYLSKHPDNQSAYVALYNCYNAETAPDIIKYFSSLPPQAAKDHKFLLSNLYLKQGKVAMAKGVNNSVIHDNPNTALSARGKLNNMYIALDIDDNIDSASTVFTNVLNSPNLLSQTDLSQAQERIETYAATRGKAKPNFKMQGGTNNSIPTTISLNNFPNPFNPSTNISYQLPEYARVSLKVYDILGREIVTLADGMKEAGAYIATFDGSRHASGVYFVRMMVQGSNAQQIVKTLKIQMLK